MKESIKLVIIIEWEDGRFGGRLKAPGFLFTTGGDTIQIVMERLRDLVEGYLVHEGRNTPEWQGIKVNDIKFELMYELSAFFEHYKDLKISAIAKRAGLNTNLLQQYVSGNKQASENQVKKIERAIHQLASELNQILLI